MSLLVIEDPAWCKGSIPVTSCGQRHFVFTISVLYGKFEHTNTLYARLCNIKVGGNNLCKKERSVFINSVKIDGTYSPVPNLIFDWISLRQSETMMENGGSSKAIMKPNVYNNTSCLNTIPKRAEILESVVERYPRSCAMHML